MTARKPSAKKGKKRCGWAGGFDLAIAYHDAEWGVPSKDDRHLFEMLILEGAQAGLSWNTILRKRAEYQRVYRGFDPAKVARFDARKRAQLHANPGIVRNRLKIEASVDNARAFLAVQKDYGSFAAYLWEFVDGVPRQNQFRSLRALPAATDVSRALSKSLKGRGFRFVGPTITYAFMQAVGMVNDHEVGCFRHDAVARLGKRFRV
ncbi:MAG: DNA-3-methyladenine glycosylase I [Myxococcota bacterium]|jgi:DNA-3-methyladenine glycosylase I|nr:DNA-3-methyladenine glycosylase I [Myxococcota bacterium]